MSPQPVDAWSQTPPREVVADVLDPGERLLWAGRPDHEALTKQARRRSSPRNVVRSVVRVALIFAVPLAIWMVTSGLGLSDALAVLGDLIRRQRFQVAMAVTILAVVVALASWLHARSARAFIERARSLTYAVTDRRLLILAGGTVERAFTPEEVRSPRIRERTAGFADVELIRRRHSGSSRGESVMARERRSIGFKALPDAENVKALIEEWRQAHLTGSERRVADFLDRADAPEDLPEEGGWRLEGGRYDLSLSVPAGWKVEVRNRAKPYGTTFMDVERWRDPEVADGWNVARVDGPFGALVEIHVDAVDEPTSTLDKAKGSTLTDWVAGEVVDVSEDVRRGRFTGWSVTRKGRSPTGGESRSALDGPGLFRVTTVYDGTIQLAFVSRWPEGSEPLQQAVDVIESTVTVRSEGAEAQPTGSVLQSTFGCAGSLITAARVGLGALILLIGVWAGYDQSSRAERYEGAAAELLAAAEEGIPTLPADDVVQSYDGQIVHVQGPLVAPTVTDSLTGLTVETWRLVRTVEAGQRGDGASDEPAVRPIPDDVFIAEDLWLGAWRLPAFTYGWPESGPVPQEILDDVDLPDGWRAASGYLYPPTADDSDVRIRYTYHPIQDERYSVLGIPDDGVLDLRGAMAGLPLMVPGTVGADSIVRAAAGTRRGVQSIWMMYAWVGLLLLIRPVARRIEALRSFTEAPLPRRILTTAAVAGAIVMVLAVLMP